MYFFHYFIYKKRNCKTISNIFTNIKKIKKRRMKNFIINVSSFKYKIDQSSNQVLVGEKLIKYNTNVRTNKLLKKNIYIYIK